MNSMNRNTHHHPNSNRNKTTTPERNASAVHTSVYGFDMYSIGLILGIALDYPKVCGNKTTNTTSSRTITVASSSSQRLRPMESNSTDTTTSTTTVDTSSSLSSGCRLAHELVTFLLTSDPYQRPDTNVALDHPFFSLYS